MKRIKVILSKWRDILCAHTGRPSIVKMSSLLKLLFSSNIIPIKFQQDFFVDVGKISLKFIWKGNMLV